MSWPAQNLHVGEFTVYGVRVRNGAVGGASLAAAATPVKCNDELVTVCRLAGKIYVSSVQGRSKNENSNEE
jgi:hypothetical protein